MLCCHSGLQDVVSASIADFGMVYSVSTSENTVILHCVQDDVSTGIRGRKAHPVLVVIPEGNLRLFCSTPSVYLLLRSRLTTIRLRYETPYIACYSAQFREHIAQLGGGCIAVAKAEIHLAVKRK